MTQRSQGVPLAELVAALSLATDLGVGQPMEHALRSCLLGVRLGENLGLDESELVHVYYGDELVRSLAPDRSRRYQRLGKRRSGG